MNLGEILICTNANWFNFGGALLALIGFLILWFSAERKLKVASKAEEARRAAILAFEEATVIAGRARDEILAVDADVQKFAKLMGSRDLRVAQQNATLEREQISQRAGHRVTTLRDVAAAKARSGAEVAILGLKVERSSLRISACLILAGFASQIAGHFPGC